MTRMQGLDIAVGEYVGDGQADGDSTEDDDEPVDPVDELEDVFDSHEEEIDDNVDSARHLLIFYDCETTGLSIYNEHVTELAAKVIGVPSASLTTSSFLSLIRTPRHIPDAGLSL